jgi:hypothetical protein
MIVIATVRRSNLNGKTATLLPNRPEHRFGMSRSGNKDHAVMPVQA